MVVYTLKTHKDSGELHLFEAKISQVVPSIECIPKNSSICKKMSIADAKSNSYFACLTEDSARKSIAKIGRGVCGTCVSHLYETYD